MALDFETFDQSDEDTWTDQQRDKDNGLFFSKLHQGTAQKLLQQTNLCETYVTSDNWEQQYQQSKWPFNNMDRKHLQKSK